MEMDEEKPIIHFPQNGETLGHYLERYTLEEKQRILEHPEASVEFCNLLLTNHWNSDSTEECTEHGLERMWKILGRLNNYQRLLYFIEMLEPTRRSLLKSLTNYASEMNIISKWCTFGRLVCCSVDSVGTIAGICLKESNSTFENLAFRLATSFGLLGLASTLAEMKISRATFYDLVTQIQRDQELFAPIQSWYQQCSDLEEMMTNIFPFDLTTKIIEEFVNIRDNEFDPVRLLSKLFAALMDKDIKLLRNRGLIKNLVHFTSCKSAQELCEWILFRRQNPIILDIARMLLQLQNSPLPFLLCQSVPALVPGHQNILSVPVLGRIGLNAWTVIDAISSLRSTENHCGAYEMKRLKNHLESELIALKRIANFIRRRANRDMEEIE